MRLIRTFITATMLATGLTLPASAAETVLFEENFETDTEAAWTVIPDSPTGTPDYSAIFNFNYSTQKFSFNGDELTIPLAPNSEENGSSGVKLQVNKNDTTAEAAAVSLYPTGESFSGNYALRADVWINYNGPAFGGSGSTESVTFGINHTGTTANWHTPAVSGDGLWFAMTGEGGAADDFAAYEWDGFGAVSLGTANGGLIGRDHGEAVFQERFSAPPFETPGAPGKRWVQLEVLQRDNTIIWKLDGYVIAERPNSSAFTEGNIMLGMMDVFSSIPNAPEKMEQNFVIFDNVRVVQLDETVPATVSLVVTDEVVSEPGTDTGELTVSRTGDTAAALEVLYRVEGSATPGTDYATLAGAVTIPAGAASAPITITAMDDNKGETNETVVVTLFSNTSYELRTEIQASVEIVDDGDVSTVNLTAADPHAYELNTGDVGTFRVTRLGDTSTDLVVNYTVAGTAQSDVDYDAIATSVTIPAGSESADITIVPNDDALLNSSRTVELTLGTGAGYIAGTSTSATVTIRNDEITPGTPAFSDDFDEDTTAEWAVNMAHEGLSTATFNWDYLANAGIPSAPHSTGDTTTGLKLEANNSIDGGQFTGISVSPVGQTFEGDYRVRFDAWINFPGPFPGGGTGSTMMFSAGVGTDGTVAQFPGTSVQGTLFAVSGDGGTGTDYRAYTNIGAPLAPESGAYAGGTQASVQNNSDPYYAPFGGRTAPEAQFLIDAGQEGTTAVGSMGMAWHDVVITKRGSEVTWEVDGVLIATVDVTEKEPLAQNIFVGFFDINAGQVSNFPMAFGLVDNIRVETLEAIEPVPDIEVSTISVEGGEVVVRFTATEGEAAAFTLESSTDITGEFTAETAATVEEVSPGTFEATVPVNGPVRFYRVSFE